MNVNVIVGAIAAILQQRGKIKKIIKNWDASSDTVKPPKPCISRQPLQTFLLCEDNEFFCLRHSKWGFQLPTDKCITNIHSPTLSDSHNTQKPKREQISPGAGKRLECNQTAMWARDSYQYSHSQEGGVTGLPACQVSPKLWGVYFLLQIKKHGQLFQTFWRVRFSFTLTTQIHLAIT